VKNGQKMKKGDEICSWDPFNAVIISEISGKVRFENVIDGITFREEVDEQSGLREKVIIETKIKQEFLHYM
jgi:DNA-directed RNA polymerase subunit beta'